MKQIQIQTVRDFYIEAARWVATTDKNPSVALEEVARSTDKRVLWSALVRMNHITSHSERIGFLTNAEAILFFLFLADAPHTQHPEWNARDRQVLRY